MAVEDPLDLSVTRRAAALPDGTGGPHVVVDNTADPELDKASRHHLERVLRLRPGDSLTVTDGRGSWRPCRLTGDEVEATGEVVEVRRLRPPLTVAFALTKADKPELAVQKLVELGIDRIVVFEADRSVAHWEPSRLPKVQLRLERIVAQAIQQSRGVWVPALEIGKGFSAAAALPGAVRCDRSGEQLSDSLSTVMVGPEGGWSDHERQALPRSVTLGETVLRAETAAITAGVLLSAARSRSAG
jgi:16S rRNA (uracil1498-N3)-methyltransferase